MDIKTAPAIVQQSSRIASKAAPQATVAEPEWSLQEPTDSWAGAALSVIGGGAAVVGAVTGNPVLSFGGSLVSATGMSMTAAKYQKYGEMNTAAVVSFVGGGTLLGIAALTSLSPAPQMSPKTPAALLLEKAMNRGF